MKMETDKIYNMDCVEGMKQIPDNSIDLVVTDPPYYKVMRKDREDLNRFHKSPAVRNDWFRARDILQV